MIDWRQAVNTKERLDFFNDHRQDRPYQISSWELIKNSRDKKRDLNPEMGQSCSYSTQFNPNQSQENFNTNKNLIHALSWVSIDD